MSPNGPVLHLVLRLIETGTLDQEAFLQRLDRDIVGDPDADDQISRCLAEMKQFIGRPA